MKRKATHASTFRSSSIKFFNSVFEGWSLAASATSCRLSDTSRRWIGSSSTDSMESESCMFRTTASAFARETEGKSETRVSILARVLG